MADIHNLLYKKIYNDPNYNLEDAFINSNVIFRLTSTNSRLFTIWPNKSISFNSTLMYQDVYYSDEYY